MKYVIRRQVELNAETVILIQSSSALAQTTFQMIQPGMSSMFKMFAVCALLKIFLETPQFTCSNRLHSLHRCYSLWQFKHLRCIGTARCDARWLAFSAVCWCASVHACGKCWRYLLSFVQCFYFARNCYDSDWQRHAQFKGLCTFYD